MADRPDTAAAGGRNKPTLELHVPEPKYRPGDEADFSHIEIPPAGEQPRPDEACDPKDMQGMAFDLVRVLGDDD